MKAVAITRFGGPEVLETLDIPEPSLAPGTALVQVEAAGVNFMDTGIRSGQLPRDLSRPLVLGVEGAGTVLALGDGVQGLEVGQKVAWVYAAGSYAEKIVAPAAALVPVPEGLELRLAASVMMQGLTAAHFAREFYHVREGDVALVHAAAGGVGLLLTQMLKAQGATVIGRVSSEGKVDVAKSAGVDHVIVEAGGDFAGRVKELTAGTGVDVVYDGSGPKTFQASLDSLKRSGTFAWYGPVLGAPEPFSLMSLPRSIKIGYAVFSDYIPTPDLLRRRATDLLTDVRDGRLRVTIGNSYPLGEAERAHRDMESRSTSGKLLLIP